ncbi:MAG: type II toxin-antitoxin system ParD family antitoxin [Anaerolineae bacterium]|nr:type II toxin-antitoxin system ParD family antitoxin [Anaerolineae bacterium]
MTIKTSISLPDAQATYAKGLVERGRFPSLSALVQHSLDVLREKEADERADREALKALLAERAGGDFVDAETFRTRTDNMLSDAVRRYAVDD